MFDTFVKKIKSNMRNILLLLLISALFSGCIQVNNGFDRLPPGIWRATLDLEQKAPLDNVDEDEVENRAFEEVAKGELPFNLEIRYEADNSISAILYNGDEKMEVKNVEFGRMKYRPVDTFQINFPVYDTYIKGTFQERFMKGKWIVNYKNNYEIPFTAEYGRDFRFSNLKKEPKIDLNGKWEVMFSLEDDPYPAIGEFVQKGNRLTGTFLTETGDYRFLEGTIQDEKIYLSCFDGSHAFLFEGKVLEDESLIGTFRSGSHYKTTWSARRNPDAILGDPDKLTFLKEGYNKFDFSFENTEGKLVSLSDKKYDGKVKLVQILGTWCPNCRDETNFLLDYLQKNPSNKLEVIGISYERYKEKEKAISAIKRYKDNLNIPYDLLYGGYANKSDASETLPMLNKIISYPTLIFIDKNDKVRKIHTGFSGPATSSFNSFQKEFNVFMEELLNE